MKTQYIWTLLLLTVLYLNKQQVKKPVEVIQVDYKFSAFNEEEKVVGSCKDINTLMKKDYQVIKEELEAWIGSLPLKTKRDEFEPYDSCLPLEKLSDSLNFQLRIKKPKYQVKKEIKIAIIDTGIDYRNPVFAERIFKPKMNLPEDFKGFDLVNEDFHPIDKDGHGTHVAGIIIGLFPEAKILPIKFHENGNSASLAWAIKIAVKSKVDIINISGGGSGYIDAEHEAIQMAKASGILVVAAAGNDHTNLDFGLGKYYPASYKEENIISVMANNLQGQKADFSNYGIDTTHISALGYIESYVPKKQSGNCIGFMKGTSQATPIVTAGAAILMASNPSLSFSEVKERLIKGADSIKSLSKFNQSQGRLNLTRTVSGQFGN